MNFDTIKLTNKGKTKMVGHRGVAGLEVENTRESFIAAANRTYFGLETDIYVVKDKKFVISHDPDLNRLAGINKNVMNMTYEELRNVNLRNDKSYSIYGNHPILFEEYVQICKHYHKVPVIELKDGFAHEDLERLLVYLKNVDIIHTCKIISFNFGYLKEIRNMNSEISLQLLTGAVEEHQIKDMIQYNIGLDANHAAITKELIERLHQNNLEVNAWTVDTLDVAERLVSWNIDYITSNILE